MPPSGPAPWDSGLIPLVFLFLSSIDLMRDLDCWLFIVLILPLGLESSLWDRGESDILRPSVFRASWSIVYSLVESDFHGHCSYLTNLWRHRTAHDNLLNTQWRDEVFFISLLMFLCSRWFTRYLAKTHISCGSSFSYMTFVAMSLGAATDLLVYTC